MGCAFSKPEISEKDLITIDQLEKELFRFQKNIRGYWRRKKTFCLKRVKPKNGPSPAPSSRSPLAEEKNPGPESNGVLEQTKAGVSCHDKSSKCQEENGVENQAEIKQDDAPPLLRPVYSKSEQIRIPGWFPLDTRLPAARSLPLQQRKLSESSQVSGADVDQDVMLRKLHVDTLYHPREDYDIIQGIGEGTYGKVHLAKHKGIQDKEYAIKSVPLKDSDKKSLVMEVEVLRRCTHKNILALADSYLTDESLFIVTDYVPGVSVYKLCEVTDGLTEKVIASVMKESLQGLAYLHQMHYIHCDVKSENILVGVNGEVKIADFGLVVKTYEKRPRGFRGTKMFASPEMANRLPYGAEIDIWGLGIVAIEMFQGYPPLDDADSPQSFSRMSRSGYSAMSEEAMSMASEVFLDFLYNGALKYNAAERLTANELLKHPFLSRGDDCQSLPLVVSWVMQEEMKEEMETEMTNERKEGTDEEEEEGMEEEMQEEEEEYCWMKSWSGTE